MTKAFLGTPFYYRIKPGTCKNLALRHKTGKMRALTPASLNMVGFGGGGGGGVKIGPCTILLQ
jgi:hypothetical protein